MRGEGRVSGSFGKGSAVSRDTERCRGARSLPGRRCICEKACGVDVPYVVLGVEAHAANKREGHGVMKTRPTIKAHVPVETKSGAGLATETDSPAGLQGAAAFSRQQVTPCAYRHESITLCGGRWWEARPRCTERHARGATSTPTKLRVGGSGEGLWHKAGATLVPHGASQVVGNIANSQRPAAQHSARRGPAISIVQRDGMGATARSKYAPRRETAKGLATFSAEIAADD